MSNRSVVALVGLVLGMGLSACAGPMSRGIAAYDVGSYSEALTHMMAAQEDLGRLSPRQHARYALYRGLVHLGLGDPESADQWLAEAKAHWDRNRLVLDQADRGRLLSAWEAMGHSAGQWGAEVLIRRGAAGNYTGSPAAAAIGPRRETTEIAEDADPEAND